MTLASGEMAKKQQQLLHIYIFLVKKIKKIKIQKVYLFVLVIGQL